jgi:hypothetical protein
MLRGRVVVVAIVRGEGCRGGNWSTLESALVDFFCFSSTFCVLFLCNFALRFWILFVASDYLVSFCLLAIVVVEVLL